MQDSRLNVVIVSGFSYWLFMKCNNSNKTQVTSVLEESTLSGGL